MDKAPRPDTPVTAGEIDLLQSMTLPYRYTGHQESTRGQMLPVYRVRAWRTANEDRCDMGIALRRAPPGAPLYKHFDGKWRTYPIPQPECLRCYPRCGLQIGHPKP